MQQGQEKLLLEQLCEGIGNQAQLGILELVEQWVGSDVALAVLMRVEPFVREACFNVQQSLKQSLELGLFPEIVKALPAVRQEQGQLGGKGASVGRLNPFLISGISGLRPYNMYQGENSNAGPGATLMGRGSGGSGAAMHPGTPDRTSFDRTSFDLQQQMQGQGQGGESSDGLAPGPPPPMHMPQTHLEDILEDPTSSSNNRVPPGPLLDALANSGGGGGPMGPMPGDRTSPASLHLARAMSGSSRSSTDLCDPSQVMSLSADGFVYNPYLKQQGQYGGAGRGTPPVQQQGGGAGAGPSGHLDPTAQQQLIQQHRLLMQQVQQARQGAQDEALQRELAQLQQRLTSELSLVLANSTASPGAQSFSSSPASSIQLPVLSNGPYSGSISPRQPYQQLGAGGGQKLGGGVGMQGAPQDGNAYAQQLLFDQQLQQHLQLLQQQQQLQALQQQQAHHHRQHQHPAQRQYSFNEVSSGPLGLGPMMHQKRYINSGRLPLRLSTSTQHLQYRNAGQQQGGVGGPFQGQVQVDASGTFGMGRGSSGTGSNQGDTILLAPYGSAGGNTGMFGGAVGSPTGGAPALQVGGPGPVSGWTVNVASRLQNTSSSGTMLQPFGGQAGQQQQGLGVGGGGAGDGFGPGGSLENLVMGDAGGAGAQGNGMHQLLQQQQQGMDGAVNLPTLFAEAFGPINPLHSGASTGDGELGQQQQHGLRQVSESDLSSRLLMASQQGAPLVDGAPIRFRVLPPVVQERVLHLIHTNTCITIKDFDDKVVNKMGMLADNWGPDECMAMLSHLEQRMRTKQGLMKNGPGYLDVAVSSHLDMLKAQGSCPKSMPIEEYAKQALLGVVYEELRNAVETNRWLQWEHLDQGIVQLVKKLPRDSAVEKLQEIAFHSFKNVDNIKGCMMSILNSKIREDRKSAAARAAGPLVLQ